MDQNFVTLLNPQDGYTMVWRGGAWHWSLPVDSLAAAANHTLQDGYCLVWDADSLEWYGQDITEYGTTLLAGTQITDITTGDVVVSYTKYNTKYIQIVGTIPAHTTRTVTLPPGCWILTCQDAVFNTKSQLQVSNGTHTAVLPMGVHLLSITALSIAIL